MSETGPGLVDSGLSGISLSACTRYMRQRRPGRTRYKCIDMLIPILKHVYLAGFSEQGKHRRLVADVYPTASNICVSNFERTTEEHIYAVEDLDP